jgi:hypothetical protein
MYAWSIREPTYLASIYISAELPCMHAICWQTCYVGIAFNLNKLCIHNWMLKPTVNALFLLLDTKCIHDRMCQTCRARMLIVSKPVMQVISNKLCIHA